MKLARTQNIDLEELQAALVKAPQHISGPKSRRVYAMRAKNANMGTLDPSSIVWGSIQLLLSYGQKEYYAFVEEVMTEAMNALEISQRETQLYCAPKLLEHITTLYTELICISAVLIKQMQRPGVQQSILFSSKVRPTVDAFLAKTQKLTTAIVREVDYLHRLEMRDTISRIVEMQIEQHKILSTLEEQRKILSALQEERKIMDVVREQQKILQTVQQIQARLQIEQMND